MERPGEVAVLGTSVDRGYYQHVDKAVGRGVRGMPVSSSHEDCGRKKGTEQRYGEEQYAVCCGEASPIELEEKARHNDAMFVVLAPEMLDGKGAVLGDARPVVPGSRPMAVVNRQQP